MNTRRPLALVIMAAVAVLATGCFNPFSPSVSNVRGISSPAPIPNTPQNVIRLLRWCWENRDAQVYRTVFSDDYKFVFSAQDSAGNPDRSLPWSRTDELDNVTKIFNGGNGPDEPAATSVTITFDPNLRADPDDRPGKDPGWHKRIETTVALSVRFPTITQEVSGNALFYVVRGDSAEIPEELQLQGYGRDPQRWYIDLWVDHTISSGAGLVANPLPPGTGAHPSGALERAIQAFDGSPIRVTWGAVKDDYRSPR